MRIHFNGIQNYIHFVDRHRESFSSWPICLEWHLIWIVMQLQNSTNVFHIHQRKSTFGYETLSRISINCPFYCWYLSSLWVFYFMFLFVAIYHSKVIISLNYANVFSLDSFVYHFISVQVWNQVLPLWKSFFYFLLFRLQLIN